MAKKINNLEDLFESFRNEKCKVRKLGSMDGIYWTIVVEMELTENEADWYMNNSNRLMTSYKFTKIEKING